MTKLPIGDIGPCEVTWDYEDTQLIITPYLGRISIRMADTVTDIHEEGGGIAPMDAFFGGAVMEFEIPMARNTLIQLAQTIGYATMGTLVGTVLTLHNIAGFDMFALSKQILIKPICNNCVPDTDPRTWTLIHRCHPYRDIDLGYDRGGQRIHLVKFKVFPNRDTGYEGDYFQEGFLCPPATPAMTRRYLDPDWFVEYKALCVFEDTLCIWDRGPNATDDGQVLYTRNGVDWWTLFSRTAAQIGATSDLSGNAMAVYNDHLFITLYRSDVSGTYPRVIEWDGTDVLQHLKSPAGNNYMGSDLVVWDGNLWCLTDVTPGVGNSRRVVYYYNGAAWTAIILYDGAAFLDYNKPAQLPINDLRPRCTRLFVFNDELYLVATRYTGTKWAWEVWKFDAVAYDNFTQIYDSDVFDDGNVLAAIIEFEGNVKIVSNEIVHASGNPSMDGKIYTSSDMATWTVESTLLNLGFPFGEELFRPATGECLVPSMSERFYLNCVNVDPGDLKTCIRYWDEALGEFTLEQEITTNLLTAGGGLKTFRGHLILKNALYAGKYKEVYANAS